MDTDWIKIYWDFMIKEDFENAIPLKDLHFPESFFKYRRLSEKTIETLEDNYIWLAEISSLNDPFECSIQFDNDECLREYYASKKFITNFNSITGQDLTKQEIEILTTDEKPYERFIEICGKRKIQLQLTAKQQIDKIQQRWKEIIDESTQNLRICSFSTVKYSLLLWSHYSLDHKGICLEYNFQNHELVRPFIQPVLYSDKVHKIGKFEDYTTMQMIGSSLIKSIDWKYEREWRLTIFKQKEKFPQKVTVEKPKAIYLGTCFYKNDKKLISKFLGIAKNKNIQVYQMDKHPTEFRLIEKKNTTDNNVFTK